MKKEIIPRSVYVLLVSSFVANIAVTLIMIKFFIQ